MWMRIGIGCRGGGGDGGWRLIARLAEAREVLAIGGKFRDAALALADEIAELVEEPGSGVLAKF